MGLPPPTRGILFGSEFRFLLPRSTPAHAGNTVLNAHTSPPGAVYPRPRGEYGRGGRRILRYHGLPPPTRGILAASLDFSAAARSTPAHAGNTLPQPVLGLRNPVYPRPRGEYPPPCRPAPLVQGLPPPTRGIRKPPPLWAGTRRSTPAHAGNTNDGSWLRASLKVYPRPRGEYLSIGGNTTPSMGLPPPTRGIRFLKGFPVIPIGSTPAHAGNTNALFGAPPIGWVYPRPRGEYGTSPVTLHIRIGLPPPTRGIPPAPLNSSPSLRSTPAHAGNTAIPNCAALCWAVYPRPRGEYWGLHRPASPRLGLPPPTRGIP